MESSPADAYQRWLLDYRDRRGAFQEEVVQASQESWQEALEESEDPRIALPKAVLHARRRRSVLSRKFCMLLWSRNFDEALFNELAGGVELDLSRDEASRRLRNKATNFRPRIARLTVRLDLAGLYALMLYPEGKEGAPPEPLVLRASGEMDMWFHLFTMFAELAQAIIIEGNYGHGSFAEMQHIERAGLGSRVLLFDINDELYRFDDDRRWPLEEVGDAVAYAAAKEIQP